MRTLLFFLTSIITLNSIGQTITNCPSRPDQTGYENRATCYTDTLTIGGIQVQNFGYNRFGNIYYNGFSTSYIWSGAGIVDQGLNAQFEPYAKVSENIDGTSTYKITQHQTCTDLQYNVVVNYTIKKEITVRFIKPNVPHINYTFLNDFGTAQTVELSVTNANYELINWQRSCSGTSGWSHAGGPEKTIYRDENSPVFYRAECVTQTLGCCCRSGFSQPVRIDVVIKPNTNPPNCNQGEVDESSYNKNRSDFHQYSVLTEVCDKSIDGSDCNSTNVYNILKQNRDYTIPQYSDMTFGLGSTIGSGYDKVMSFFGSKSISTFLGDSEPTINCGTKTIVPWYYALYPLAKGLGNIIGCSELNSTSLGGDPIVQSIDDSQKSVTNFTLPGHMLHPGKVINTVIETGCKVYLQTIGMGNNDLYYCGPVFGYLASNVINVSYGRSIFSNLGSRVKNYFDSKLWK
jgi:hypothetical protein